MDFKDISNADLVNLSNCENEPIHIPGSIQPFGFLLAVDEQFVIRFCSVNAEACLLRSLADLIGKSFLDVFGAEEQESFRAYLNDPDVNFEKPHVCYDQDTPYNTAIHNVGGLWVLELEPFPDGYAAMPDLYQQTRRFVSVLGQSKTLQSLCQSISEEVKHITGYDRVMIYKFDKDFNGEVFAESKREDLEPFLGLHYPHTDIPVQARTLYLKNLMRLIADVNYTPVPIVAAAAPGVNNSSLDLGMSILRSVSPIHIEYLKNMGVSATLTISLILDGKLWGLIACHHYSPKNIPYYVRLSALLQGHFLTSQISVRMVAEEHDLTLKTDANLNEFLDKLIQNKDVDKCIVEPSLLKLANANGVAILHNNKIFTHGATPVADEIKHLVTWLQGRNYKELITSKLSEVYKGSKELLTVSAGIMFFAINNKTGDCIIWFREEKERSISWAGDPERSIVKNEKGLSPRKSFELWKEIIKFQGSDWLVPEVNAARQCAYSISKDFLLAGIIMQEEYQRSLGQKLQSANDELANINWIGSHDLKEPLRKIQVFASKLLGTPSYELKNSARAIVTRMEGAAYRMQNLLDDILDYSRLGNIEKSLIYVDLNDVLNGAIEEMDEMIKDKNAAIIIRNELPVIRAVPFQVRQLFINILSNSLKFSKNDDVSITISCELVNPAQYKITFADNGIGFKPDYAATIFKVFQRLNNTPEYVGTGIGLAICKKIMENHRGSITADGELGKGATFALYFPIE